MSLICVSIQAKSIAELKRKIRLASRTSADILEIWIDRLPPQTEPKQVLPLSKKPILIVNKNQSEMGLWKGTEKQRIKKLKEYLQANADYIDIGINTAPALIKDFFNVKKKISKNSTKVIISHHDFSGTPNLKDLVKIFCSAVKYGSDFVKIITTAKKIQDNLVILNLLNMARLKKWPLIAHCMGKCGTLSRVLGPVRGSAITYLALNKASKTAPGQLTLEEYNLLTKKLLS